MRKVIKRIFDTAMPFPGYEDVDSTYAEAENICGQKLDTRRNYAIIKGCVCELLQNSGACSGCSPDDPYWDGDRGGGCEECGYTGRRRYSMWFPIDPEAEYQQFPEVS